MLCFYKTFFPHILFFYIFFLSHILSFQVLYRSNSKSLPKLPNLWILLSSHKINKTLNTIKILQTWLKFLQRTSHNTKSLRICFKMFNTQIKITKNVVWWMKEDVAERKRSRRGHMCTDCITKIKYKIQITSTQEISNQWKVTEND